MADREQAIRTIEDSRQTHVDWRDHILGCDHCAENPPEYVHGPAEQDEIIAAYDNVLAVLKGEK